MKLFIALLSLLITTATHAQLANSPPPVATFSIVAHDAQTGEWGVAVQSKFIAVGSVVPWAKADVGAVATQAWANTTFGPRSLDLMQQGLHPTDIIQQLTDADPGHAKRQLGIVDAQGRAATFTGDECTDWAGGKTGLGYCVQGNILAGPEVINAMAATYESASGDLGDRLIAALAAGQAAGGDKRGRQSAALLIVKKDAGYSAFNDRYRDLRVDDHPTPIAELARIYAIHKSIFLPPNSPQSAHRLGNQMTRRFFDQDYTTLWQNMTDPMRAALSSDPQQLKAFGQSIAQQFGAPTQIIHERASHVGPHRVYQRHLQFEKSPATIEISWTFDTQSKIAGFFIKPATAPAPTTRLDYPTKTHLTLPFQGAWTVTWGGRDIIDNYHAIAPDQRFAYDFLIQKNGSTHRNQGRSNDDYYCFNEPVLAPAPGVIVAVTNNLPDNTPGEMDPANPPGNHVIIDHQNGEFSFLAHFKQNSILPKPGDTINTGDLLGLCGNSGNSSEPHLHYHLQTTPTFAQGEGLPAPFNNYSANNIPTKRGEPTRSTIIHNINPNP